MLIYHAAFEATLAEVSRVCEEFNALATARGGVDWAAMLDLGLTEALSNVVRHGYGPEGRGRICFTCVESEGQWCMELADRGDPIPANRLSQADGSVFDFDPLDLMNIPEGGMGLPLIRSCFDGLAYHADDSGNRLALTKQLKPLSN
jgi:serine/threonine-protein kinase RsbW